MGKMTLTSKTILCSALFFLIATVGSTSAAEEGNLQGEVFIVTEKAENILLGLVEVQVFPEDQIKKYIAEREKRAQDEIPDFEEDRSAF